MGYLGGGLLLVINLVLVPDGRLAWNGPGFRGAHQPALGRRLVAGDLR